MAERAAMAVAVGVGVTAYFAITHAKQEMRRLEAEKQADGIQQKQLRDEVPLPPLPPVRPRFFLRCCWLAHQPSRGAHCEC